jgi:hypothetical protein
MRFQCNDRVSYIHDVGILGCVHDNVVICCKLRDVRKVQPLSHGVALDVVSLTDRILIRAL